MKLIIFFISKDSDGVFVLGVAEKPWLIDNKILSRFQKLTYIPLPDEEARYELFKVHLRSYSNSLTDVDFRLLSKKSEGFSGADIKMVISHSFWNAIRTLKEKNNRNLRKIKLTMDDILVSLAKTRPTVSEKDVKEFEQFMNR